jgi:AraC-like DNA-binding protein
MSSVSPAPQPLVAFSGRDPGAAVSALGEIYRARDWTTGPADAEYWFRYVGVGDDRLSVRRFQLHGWLRGDAATADDVVVQWLESGRSTVDVGRGPAPVPLGVPVPLPVGRHFRVEHDHPDQRLVHLSRALLVDVASERYAVDDEVTFASQQSPDPDAVAGWRTAVTLAIAALRADGPGSLAWHEAQSDVVRALLRLHPLQAERLRVAPGDGSDRRLTAAVDHLHAHAQDALTVADLAAAAGMSVRTLQESFRRVHGRSPMSYLKSVRLEETRAELLSGEFGTVSVAEIARTWGFNHMGRFSAEYARHFGEYPHQTLRR